MIISTPVAEYTIERGVKLYIRGGDAYFELSPHFRIESIFHIGKAPVVKGSNGSACEYVIDCGLLFHGKSISSILDAYDYRQGTHYQTKFESTVQTAISAISVEEAQRNNPYMTQNRIDIDVRLEIEILVERFGHDLEHLLQLFEAINEAADHNEYFEVRRCG